MSNLSLARIMYGSSEFSAASASIDPRPSRLQSSSNLYTPTNWMSKLFSALLAHRTENPNESTKTF